MGSSDETDPAPGNAEVDGPTPEVAAPADEAPAAGEPAPAEATPAPRRRKKKKPRPAETDTFARYLAQLLVVDKGFHPSPVDEIAELAQASDLVLVRSGGGSFTIVCILDAERDPARAFAIESDRLVVMALRCCGYTGGGEGLVSVHLVEVRDAIRSEDQRRLERLCQENQQTALAAAEVRACLLAPRTGEVWSTLGWMEARWYKQALTAPRRKAEDLVPRSPATAPRKPSVAPPAPPTRAAPPWLTCGIIALTVAIFAVEGLAGVDNSPEPRSPTLDTLVAMGGVSRELVVTQGQWWRLFTATLLHGGVAHLLLNGACLFFGGIVLETLFGRAWLGAVFVLSALGGSLASITLNDPNVVSVGASGAIMGLLAAALVATYRLPAAQRPQIQWTMGRLLVPSLIPIATSRNGQHVDFAAHLGGALVGAALGLLLLATWPPVLPRPRFRRAAGALVIGGVALYVLGFVEVTQTYAGYRDAAAVELLPNDQLDSLKQANADALLTRYPRDPRARWVMATKLASAGDLPGAERHLRAALAEEGVLRRSFPDRKLEAGIRATLARVLDAQGRHDEARVASRPVCDVGAKELEEFCR